MRRKDKRIRKLESLEARKLEGTKAVGKPRLIERDDRSNLRIIAVGTWEGIGLRRTAQGTRNGLCGERGHLRCRLIGCIFEAGYSSLVKFASLQFYKLFNGVNPN